MNTANSGDKNRQPKRIAKIQSFKKNMNAKRTASDKLADWLTASFGTVTFLVINALFFILWIAVNTNMLPGIPAFDPFPFGLLTMAVSLEAIFLAIIVLVSQNREMKVAELREEIELYINTYAESEITKLMYLQTLLLKKQGIDISTDPEVKAMLEKLEPAKIEEELEKQLN